MKNRRGRQRPLARHQRGMTLLDTLVTITMIGGVSAVALPQLHELPREARIAVVEHLAGTVRSASTLAHLKCEVQSACAMQPGTATVEMGGDAVRLTHGYPTAGEPDGLAQALEFTGFGAQHSPGQTLLTKDGAPDPQRCAVAYAEPEAPGRSPRLEVFTSGC